MGIIVGAVYGLMAQFVWQPFGLPVKLHPPALRFCGLGSAPLVPFHRRVIEMVKWLLIICSFSLLPSHTRWPTTIRIRRHGISIWYGGCYPPVLLRH